MIEVRLFPHPHWFEIMLMPDSKRNNSRSNPLKIFFPIIFTTYTENAIKRAFEKCHIEFESETYYTPKDFYQDEFLEMKIKSDVKKADATHIFTINYFPLIAVCAAELGIPYVSWSYDSPLNLPTTDTMDFDTNRIYLFDRAEVEYYKSLDIKNVFHLPLAVDCDALSKIKKPDSKKYDVSFLGSFYENDLFRIIAPLPQNTKEMLVNAVMGTLGNARADAIESTVTDFTEKKINKEYYDATWQAAKEAHVAMPENVFQINKRQLTFLMNEEATREERLLLLGSLSPFHDVAIATNSPYTSLQNMDPKTAILPPQNYEDEMPAFFMNSRVNLNPALHAIKSGINLRVLDIIGTGSFCLTSNLPEIEEYFKIGEEIETYSSLEECIEKAEYYIENDSKREEIAKKGFEKAEKEFQYQDRIKAMFSCHIT